VVQRADRFRDQKITAPHTDGVKGRLFPPEQSWKSSTVLNQRPVKLCNVIETHEHKDTSQSRRGLCAFAGFSRDTSAVLRDPSFEGANRITRNSTAAHIKH
jgi:hypothetical protein